MSRKPCDTTTENRADDVGHDVPDTKVVSLLATVAELFPDTDGEGYGKSDKSGHPLLMWRNVGDECADECGDTERHKNVQEFILPLTVFTYWKSRG